MLGAKRKKGQPFAKRGEFVATTDNLVNQIIACMLYKLLTIRLLHIELA